MLHVDVSASFAKALTPSLGITDQDFTALRTGMKRYVQEWMQERSTGGHAWTMDPYHQRLSDRVKELARDGVIGGYSRTFFGCFGFVPDPTPVVRETAPAIARKMQSEGVDIALLTPG